MKTQHDLGKLDWRLSGFVPEIWRMDSSMEIGASPNAEIPAIPARVPGSVQSALRDAGLLPDWNVGLNYRDCEWVENRHWVYETRIPDEWIRTGLTHRLNCLGLDYSGEVYLNAKLVGEFEGSHIPHVFDLTPHLAEKDNALRIVFLTPPRWLGQFGRTSEMKEWKVRFNYTWDWTARLVQTGIWDAISLEVTDCSEIQGLRCWTDADADTSTGSLNVMASVSAADGGSLECILSHDGQIVRRDTAPVTTFTDSLVGISWADIPVSLWWPNMHGDQPLCDLTVRLLGEDGSELDRVERRVGFKHVNWLGCEDAPEEADPWICEVNGKPIFLQGVNWVPPLPNFADVSESRYRKLLELYRDLGLNVLRVWGGAILEKQCFYDLCDELGIMVWQEFPLSSSGVDNYPPDDAKSVEEQAVIARSYIIRRQHHASLLLWSGGNELMKLDGTPVGFEHPMMARFKEIADELDPVHRLVPTSASGPTEWVTPGTWGQGIHWDVHGPWKADGNLAEGWSEFWASDDSLFRSETGAPGCSSAEMISRFAGELDVMPATPENPLWRRTSTWWIEWGQFVAEVGRDPESLEEYVAWSQERQKQALVIAARRCKERFPACGGIILWMGHDCFPCTANTSVVDFDCEPKPVAVALADIFRG